MKSMNLDTNVDYFYAIEADLDEGEFEEITDGLMLPLYWNNNNGWGSLVDATNFTEEEFLEFELPELSHWVKVEVISNWTVSLDMHVIHMTFAVDRYARVYPKTRITDPDSEGKVHLRIV